MKILISGAGIAGLCLAYWLHHEGHEPVIVEKASDIRTEGYMIDFGGSGYDVADRMALVPALNEKKHDISLIQYKNAHGRTTAEIKLSKFYQLTDVSNKFIPINHRDLVSVLYAPVRDKVEVRFGTQIEQICQTEHHVSVQFSDGQAEDFDLLIGADGIHSQVRRLVFGKESTFSRYLGYHFAIFLIPALDYDLDQTYTMYVEPKMQVGIYPTPEGQWMIFVVTNQPDAVVPPREQRVRHLRQMLSGKGWLIPEVLGHLHDDTPVFYDTVTQIQIPRWSSNRVALIGDAAHCPTLVSGQGASMAMTGAYFLSQELAKTDSPQEAFQSYEARLRPHIEKIQRRTRNFAPNFIPQSHLRIALLNWALRLVDLPVVSTIVGKQVSLESIIPAEA